MSRASALTVGCASKVSTGMKGFRSGVKYSMVSSTVSPGAISTVTGTVFEPPRRRADDDGTGGKARNIDLESRQCRARAVLTEISCSMYPVWRFKVRSDCEAISGVPPRMFCTSMKMLNNPSLPFSA